MKQMWIRVKKEDEVPEVERFILSLADEELLGEVSVVIYNSVTHRASKLSHIYDVSESALHTIMEKYGEENVKLCDREEKRPEPGIGKSLSRIADSLETLCNTLEAMQQSLEVLEELTGCLAMTRGGTGKLFCVTGNISTD